MIRIPNFSKLSLLLLSFAVLSFTACDDDDDNFLGIDLDDDGTLFMSSNTSGTAGVLDLEDTPLEIMTFVTQGTDADGIYYDEDEGTVFQINRTANTLVEYNDVIDDLDDPNGVDVKRSSTSDFTNGRGLAVRNKQYVVAQDAAGDGSTQNRFVVYSTVAGDAIQRSATYNTDINLWGIQFVGADLYAVIDNSDSVAVFRNFLSNTNNSTLTPDVTLKIDGIGRTHGLEYNEEDDVMILTDIDDATSDSDGAIVVIRNFTSLAGSGTITSANYTRIAGSNTMLGNPVDVAWDEETDRIYVAERARNGGMLLIFNSEASSAGNVAPVQTLPFAGISSLYLHRD